MALHSRHPQMMGEFFFVRGRLVHSTVGQIEGNDAIFEVVRWHEGTFAYYVDEWTERTTVTEDLQNLLVKAIETMDFDSTT